MSLRAERGNRELYKILCTVCDCFVPRNDILRMGRSTAGLLRQIPTRIHNTVNGTDHELIIYIDQFAIVAAIELL